MTGRVRQRPAVRLGAVVASGALLLAGAPMQAAVAQEDGTWWRQAWEMPRVAQLADGSNVTVALLDDGVNADVPELHGAVVPGLDQRDSAGDGRSDYGETGHGTAMGALIAARPGESRVVGVAPGSSIFPVATPEGFRDFQRGLFEGFQRAAEAGAVVANISIVASSGPGGSCPDEVANAVRYALSQDIVVVAGAGNVDSDVVGSPANCEGVVTVGAVNRRLEPWATSNRSEHVDVAAPGVGIASRRSDGEVALSEGTSNATALVSGTVALLRERFPEASADEIVTRLVATAQDVGPSGYDEATGHGMVRPLAALTADVPADATNPVYDPLGDLQALEWTEPTEETAPEGPEFSGLDGGDDGGDGDDVVSAVLLVIGGVLLVGAIGGAVLYGLRRRSAALVTSQREQR